MNERESLLERLAELEHEQWVAWSKAVAPEVAEERRRRWQEFYVPYARLPEDVKELDRVWARKVLKLLEAQALQGVGLKGPPP
jgi:hypothetical protein